MKLDKPINNNYCATVVEVKAVTTLPNCDNVVSLPIFGYTAIVSKDTQVGDLGILFSAETQLADDYCYENNLYRHADKNQDESVKGYIEDNRRIKAVKFRGNTSSALFMPLSSLAYTGINVSDLRVGDEFDNLSGREICKKYTVERKGGNIGGQKAEDNTFRRVDNKHMPEHISTDNYFKWGFNIAPEEDIIVTQKLHGTSIRVGNTIVRRRKTLGERMSAFIFKARIVETEYDSVYGSRKVIKDANNPYQNHFYATDIWTEEGSKLQGLLPKGYVLFGELIGLTSGGAEIQKDYAYNLTKPELYVYRIANVNEDGIITDLSWKQVKEFCGQTGLKAVPELWTGKKSDFKVEDFIDVRIFDTHKNALYLGDNDLVDEGVCVRVEGLVPKIYKAKSPKFLEHETTLLDTGTEDLESTQSI